MAFLTTTTTTTTKTVVVVVVVVEQFCNASAGDLNNGTLTSLLKQMTYYNIFQTLFLLI